MGGTRRGGFWLSRQASEVIQGSGGELGSESGSRVHILGPIQQQYDVAVF